MEDGEGIEIREIIFYLTNILLIKYIKQIVFEYFYLYILWFFTTQQGSLNWKLQVFTWILHTNISLSCPLFTEFTQPYNNNDAVFK
jgi:hypothetical protein